MTVQTRILPWTEHHLLVHDDFFKASTYAVCLYHVYVAVCVIIHLLVDTTDRLEAENANFILA